MATLKDIARECGVSAMTVSSVLNNKPGEVGPQTRERVLAAAKRLNYHPNAAAQRLAGKRINTLGVADWIADPTYWGTPYQSPVIEGILSAARREGQDILYFAGHPSGDLSASLPVYSNGRCDGVLHFAATLGGQSLLPIQESGLPIVLIGDSRPDAGISYIDVDNVQAAEEAVQYLIELGHRRIGMIGVEESAAGLQRIEGYRRALETAGLPVDESLISVSPAWEVYAEQAAARFLSRPDRPTALFCFNDQMALGALRAAAQLGLRAPQDVSVIGFDDIALASHAEPPLTTVRQPLRQVGETAVSLLLSIIKGEKKAGDSVTVPHELMVRESTAPAPRG